MHKKTKIKHGAEYLTPTELRIAEFAQSRHLKTDLPSRLKKLGEEFGELAEAVANTDYREIAREAADMGIVLSHMLMVCGYSLQRSMLEKMIENEGRHIWEAHPKYKGAHICARCKEWTRNLPHYKNERCPAFTVVVSEGTSTPSRPMRGPSAV